MAATGETGETGATGATTDPHCLFCRIVDGSIPSAQVYRDDDVMAFRDLNPQAPTHVLIIPRWHVSGINAPDAANGPMLAAMVRAANAVARAERIAESGFRLVWNVGPDAGQSVFHLHLHLLGGRHLGWPPG
jgi:histidine triad (HIT) family protein